MNSKKRPFIMSTVTRTQSTPCYMPECEDAPTALADLRERVKEEGSIAEVARKVDMPRAWLSRVLSPKTGRKLKEVANLIDDD
jgi:DNA-binding phage protein